MKKIIVLSVLVLLACQLFSQSKYKAGDVVVGKNVKYICKRGIGVTPYVRIDNSNNRDTTLNRYYNDGTLVDEFEETAASYRFGRSDLYSVVKLIFTKEELKLLKDNRVTLTIYFTTNNKRTILGGYEVCIYNIIINAGGMYRVKERNTSFGFGICKESSC